MKQPRINSDLVDWLEKIFPPRCISAAEDPIMAHRYAAQVELAQRLIKMGKSDENDGVSTFQED
ncbi:hypothetical protein [Mesorhizobium sp. M0767]|uniref:hypothetical protein n=1 Tax=Mesorhizobium sp. M0767 TaxID=2956995 RepID=UPI00333B4382